MKGKMIADSKEFKKLISKLAKDIVSHPKYCHDIALIGIRTRGVPIAKRLARQIQKLTRNVHRTGSLDINLYRDDLSKVSDHPILHRTEISFSIHDRGLVMVDDVLYTGRTARSAMDALIDLGRPKFIQLATIIDRYEFRELPIQADFVALQLKTTAAQNVKVRVKEVDGIDEIFVLDQKE